MGTYHKAHGGKKHVSSHEKIVALEKIMQKYDICSEEVIEQSGWFDLEGVSFVVEIAKVLGWADTPYNEEDEK